MGVQSDLPASAYTSACTSTMWRENPKIWPTARPGLKPPYPLLTHQGLVGNICIYMLNGLVFLLRKKKKEKDCSAQRHIRTLLQALQDGAILDGLGKRKAKGVKGGCRSRCEQDSRFAA